MRKWGYKREEQSEEGQECTEKESFQYMAKVLVYHITTTKV